MDSLVVHDGQNERIAELEAKLLARDERIAELGAKLLARDERIADLEQQVAGLSEKLGQNSQNSHLPPSTDPPGTRKWRKTSKKSKPQSKRKRGGQPGHRGANRDLLPPDKVNKFVDLYPSHCENCWQPLPEVLDPEAKRYQQTEIPPIQPHTTEFCRRPPESVAI